MIQKVDTQKKVVEIKGSVNSQVRAVLAKLENIGYTVVVLVVVN